MVNAKDLIQKTGLLILLLSMYSIFTISSITESWTVTFVLLISSLLLLALSKITNTIYISSIFFVGFSFAVLCLIGVLKGSPVVFFGFYLVYFLLLLASNNIDYQNYSVVLKSFRVFGIIFAIGSYWQYFFPNMYAATLFPLFGSEYQRSIRRQFYFHKMCTGFTSQSVASAGFIILGIICAIYTIQSTQKEQFKKKIRNILLLAEVVALTGGFLLTGKRSPIINFFSAFIVVDFLSTKRNKRITRIFEIVFVLSALIIIIYLAAPFFSDSRNTIIRLIEYANLADGGDITNGRIALYADAVAEFKSSPLFGIGWGNYSIKYETSGAHNIYLQLLCECGIIGFTIALVCMGAALINSIVILRRINVCGDDTLIMVCKLSVFLQIYTWVYGVFGNPIYDQNYLAAYMIGLMLSASARKAIRERPAFIAG